MIDNITTKAQLADFVAAVKAAAAKASELADTEDGGTCNMDSCVVKINIPKRLREASGLRLFAGWGLYKGYWHLQDIPSNGCGNRNTRQQEAAAKYLQAAGYHATVRYCMD
ncbi:MAG: hypothetical protein NC403_08440 [Muribaculaceae bacterium]|nr:hypothetical protein [Muribaculaceae bacterium]